MGKNSYSWAKRYEFPAQTKKEAAAYLADAIKSNGWNIIYGNPVSALILQGSLEEYAKANDIPFNPYQIVEDLKDEHKWDCHRNEEVPWLASDFC